MAEPTSRPLPRERSWTAWSVYGSGADSASQLADLVREHIMIGGFSPGERLPTERDMAAVLGLSRNTIRAALQRLASEGLIVTGRGRTGGNRVVPAPDLVPALEDAVWGERHGRMERLRTHVSTVMEYRKVLEPAATGLAAERATPAETRRLRALLECEATDLFSYHTADNALHEAVGRLSKNVWLEQAIRDARARMLRVGNVLWMRTNWTSVYASQRDIEHAFAVEHRGIVENIADGDGENAEQAMREHLDESLAQFETLLSERPA